jgi:uncharacterized protein YdaU (DUF1376 family)
MRKVLMGLMGAGLLTAAVGDVAQAAEPDVLEMNRRVNAFCRAEAQRVDSTLDAYFNAGTGMHHFRGLSAGRTAFKTCLAEATAAYEQWQKDKWSSEKTSHQ